MKLANYKFTTIRLNVYYMGECIGVEIIFVRKLGQEILCVNFSKILWPNKNYC